MSTSAKCSKNWPLMDDIVDDLISRWEKHGSLIIAVDFDDTIYDFYGKNKYNLEYTRQIIRDAISEGLRVVIYTARPKHTYPDIIKFCEEHKLKIEGININAITSLEDIGTNGKIYYNLLLDDKAGLMMAAIVLRKVVERIKKIRNGD